MTMKVLRKGAHSTVFIDENEPGIVIKKANNPENSSYLSKQQYGYDVINSIKAQGNDIGVILPELVAIDNEEKTVKEKIISGETFDSGQAINEKYSRLSAKQKDSIAQQMARFLNAMHSSSECKPAQESIINMQKSGPANADEIIAKFGGYLPKNITNRLKQAEAYLHASDKSDEFIVMTHKDLRTSNVMYDANMNKLAVIDFELAGLDNVYNDFIASAPGSSMPWDFTKRVIDFYNQIPDKKYPITINPEKVQNMLLYGVMHEYARNIRPNDNTQEYLVPLVTRLTNKLMDITGIDIDKKASYRQAIRTTQDKQRQKKLENTKNYPIIRDESR